MTRQRADTQKPAVGRKGLAWFGLVAASILLMAIGLASGDSGPRTDSDRAFDIKKTTLCPICDGQNVLESNAPIATSIRVFIDELVAVGDTDAEIRAALASEFGDDVNSNPPRTGVASLVWVLPVVGLIGGAAALGFGFRRWSDQAADRATAADRALVERARQAP